MANNGYIKKRPCRICRKWFLPNHKVKNQQTCGTEKCQTAWHAKQCGKWNKKSRSYFRNIYLNKKLQNCSPTINSPKNTPSPKPKHPKFPQLPQDVVQEAIGAQHYIIIEYLAQLLLRLVQEAITKQLSEYSETTKQLPSVGRSRGVSQREPP